MTGKICIYEDENYSNFFPLTYFRPVCDLLAGTNTLRQKALSVYNYPELYLHTRDYLKDVLEYSSKEIKVNTTIADRCLYINAAVIAFASIEKNIPLDGPDEIFVSGEEVVAFRIAENSKQLPPIELLKTMPAEAKRTEVQIQTIKYLWDIIALNGNLIEKDFEILTTKENQGHFENVAFIGKEKIHIGNNVQIFPFASIDATPGPVIIEDNVIIEPNTFVQGPLFIGNNTRIKSGAKIYGHTSIGKACKIGGEIESSIIMPFTNKQHDGFLGHSYLGSWINLGAGTTNSDLKNNYGNITVNINDAPVNTGKQFVGLMMGDHSKTAVGTLFNTGSVVGVSSNLFDNVFGHKNYPSFFWGGDQIKKTNELEKSIEVAKIVMGRRNIEMSVLDEVLFRKIFEITKEERV